MRPIGKWITLFLPSCPDATVHVRWRLRAHAERRREVRCVSACRLNIAVAKYESVTRDTHHYPYRT